MSHVIKGEISYKITKGHFYALLTLLRTSFFSLLLIFFSGVAVGQSVVFVHLPKASVASLTLSELAVSKNERGSENERGLGEFSWSLRQLIVFGLSCFPVEDASRDCVDPVFDAA